LITGNLINLIEPRGQLKVVGRTQMRPSPFRVLIIGEDRSHLQHLKDALDPLDAQFHLVEVGSYGRSFLRDTQRTPPAAILMHIPTATMKSLSALASMRMLHPEVPIVVLSSDPSVLNVAIGQDLSRPRLVSPDLDPVELRDLIRSTLEEALEAEEPPPERATTVQRSPEIRGEGIPLPAQMQLEALFPGYRVFIGTDGS
jgi:DNA-binding NarL/FixJ family response regulator